MSEGLETVQYYYSHISSVDISNTIIIILSLVILILVFIIKELRKSAENTEEKYKEVLVELGEHRVKVDELTKPIRTEDGQRIKSFIKELVHDKFDYFLYKDILPIYNDGKIPESKTIDNIKNSIYLSITAGLSIKQKKAALDHFSVKGIEMIIHEYVIVLFNKVDYKINLTNGTKVDIDLHSDKISPVV